MPTDAYVASVGWGNHTFDQLANSDNLRVLLECENETYDFTLDYITPPASGNANNQIQDEGWTCTTGGDGSPPVPAAPNLIIASESAMTYNLNVVTFEPPLTTLNSPGCCNAPNEPPGHPEITMSGDYGADPTTGWV